jgi:hypothetical protein
MPRDGQSRVLSSRHRHMLLGEEGRCLRDGRSRPSVAGRAYATLADVSVHEPPRCSDLSVTVSCAVMRRSAKNRRW